MTKLSDLPGAVLPTSLPPRSAADDSLIHEVHHALQAAQRHTCVPVRVLDLLAAAPDLLHALENMPCVICMSGPVRFHIPGEPDITDCPGCARARAAIALARGTS